MEAHGRVRVHGFIRHKDRIDAASPNELKLKLTIQVSPRTVGKYLRNDRPARTPDPKQRWLTFVRNHAKVLVATSLW